MDCRQFFEPVCGLWWPSSALPPVCLCVSRDVCVGSCVPWSGLGGHDKLELCFRSVGSHAQGNLWGSGCRFGSRKFPVSKIPYPEYFGTHPEGRVTVRDMLECTMHGHCDGNDVLANQQTNGTAPLYVFERVFLNAIAPELLEDFPKVTRIISGVCPFPVIASWLVWIVRAIAWTATRSAVCMRHVEPDPLLHEAATSHAAVVHAAAVLLRPRG